MKHDSRSVSWLTLFCFQAATLQNSRMWTLKQEECLNIRCWTVSLCIWCTANFKNANIYVCKVNSCPFSKMYLKLSRSEDKPKMSLLFSIQDGSILCQHTGANAVITCQVDFPRLCRKRQSVHPTLPSLCLSLPIRFTWGTGEVGCSSQKHTPLDSAALCMLWSVNMIKSWCGPQEAGSDTKTPPNLQTPCRDQAL